MWLFSAVPSPALCYKKGSVDGGKTREFWSPGSLALNLGLEHSASLG